MISYRQADLLQRFKSKTADTYRLIFKFDEGEEGLARFYFYAIDQMNDMRNDDKWQFLMDHIPGIIEREREHFDKMDVFDAGALLKFVINGLASLPGVLSAEQTNQEVEQEKYNRIDGEETGDPMIMRYTVTVKL